jgi:hypothetical protein
VIAMRLALRSSCFFRSLDVLSLRWWDAVVWMGPSLLSDGSLVLALSDD